MKLTRIVILVFLCIILTRMDAFCQDGDYFLTHHLPSSDLFDNVNFSLVQDQHGILWIANRKGVIQYDGQTWTLFPSPSAVFQLVVANDNTVYAGGRDLIGKISWNEKRQLDFQIIRFGPDIDDIISATGFHDDILFLTENRLYVYSPDSDSLSIHLTDTGQKFRNLFSYQNEILINTHDAGLLKLSDKYQDVAHFDAFDSIDSNIIWIEERSASKSAILTSEGDIWINRGDSLALLALDDKDYLGGSIPIRLLWVSDTLFAVSTLSGGVVFVDSYSEKIDGIINYHTGLPDNQVYTILTDSDEGVWVAHDYGFTRIAPLISLRNYSNIPGIEGNILSIIKQGDNLYAGTNLGVYYLEKVEDYQETAYYIQRQPPDLQKKEVIKSVSKSNTTQISDATDPSEPSGKHKNKKGLFSFLKKNDKKNENGKSGTDQTEAANRTADQVKPTTGSKKGSGGIFSKLFGGKQNREIPRVEWERRIKRELLSIRYVFKKIEGIPAKTDLMLSLNDRVIAGSLSGIYEIRDDNSLIISEAPVRHLLYSDENDLLFASTYENEILTFKKTQNGWLENNLLEGLEDVVFQISEFGKDIWLCGADSLYRIEIENGELTDVDVFKINNPYFERTYAVPHDGRMIFVKSSGYSYYDPENREIVEDIEMKVQYGNPEQIFVSNDHSLWIFNGSTWHILGATYGSDGMEFLNAFDNIRQLAYSDEEDTYWVVTQNNQIYGIRHPDKVDLSMRHGIYLKEIRSASEVLSPTSDLNIQMENNSLSFRFVQPDYSGLMHIEYRFRLTGLSEQWSEWSSDNNFITFSFLPPGEYALEFHTRNVFGRTSAIEPITFRVIPPYWRRPWFYALEVLFFTTLLVLSIRLNRSNVRYRLISRLLAFLTLILILEFVQTIAEYQLGSDTSPVVDFFIKVSIALLVLPVESLLRKAILKPNAGAIKAVAEKTLSAQEKLKTVGNKSA